ncbi:histidine--tRNA ligase [Verrucomicrobiaceae bacterium N1E253]|uniref:Histidine--tRNA ligase n=1 Tax=Oceaniferula marina TaxID=2748318 RepID=A0A851GBS6_9BACT|nr:histidine--tRNA ligase [Oceaniferula marina]NWK54629.1 histidine--tRNA ligase [Oceaniferula marina]
MADKRFQSLPGFRDFTPRDCAIRNYLFSVWKEVAHRYGFVEYEAPIVESTDLYLKKSGGELTTQLFRFEDQGGRDITLRPELTASLARIVGANQRDYPKPLKWFEIGPCFRYEKPQKGRGREFIQFNADILGEKSAHADAELIALAIDTMLALGFKQGDFVIRASDRQSWLSFCEQHGIDDPSEFLPIIDRLEKLKPEAIAEKLAAFQVTREQVDAFISNPENASDDFKSIQADLDARGLSQFLELDLTIVRGLAYYTGAVFEIFDIKKSMRAVAGGGRYDGLLATLSDGSADLPATGFAMGDMVIRNFIEETPHAKMEMEAWLQRNAPCDVFVVLADDSKRSQALGIISRLRSAGVAVDFPLSRLNVGKQFKKAEQSGARFALVVGAEFPEMQLKSLSSRTEQRIAPEENPVDVILHQITQPDGPLIA